jgi:hypothetical protein
MVSKGIRSNYWSNYGRFHSRSKLLSLFLTTLYQQDIESGQEQLILLVVAGVVTGSGAGVCKGVGCCVLVDDLKLRNPINTLRIPLQDPVLDHVPA